MTIYQIIECEMCWIEIEKRWPRVRCAKCSNIKHNIYVRERNKERDFEKPRKTFKKGKRWYKMSSKFD